MEFYISEKINDHLTCIRSKSGELMYLLEGETECALIDSCFGIGHLRDYVKTLTDKPVTLFLTHGHIDHAMGAPEFHVVYLNEKDLPLYQKQCSLEERTGYAHATLGPAADTLKKEDFTPVMPEKSFQSLEDGMTFDFKPFTLEAFACPGHTKGTMIFLIREMKILITGDACNNATFLFDQDCLTVEEYKEVLQKNQNRLAGKYDRVLISHHVMDADADLLQQVIAVCDEVLAGKGDDLPFEFMGMHAFIAKRCNERFEREDGKFGNMIYDKQKLYTKK